MHAQPALHAEREPCMQEGISWSVDAEVSADFDSIDQARLREVLRPRVNDGRIVRLLGKWLRAVVMDTGCCSPRRPAACKAV